MCAGDSKVTRNAFTGVVLAKQWALLVPQMVNDLPAVWETQVQSLGQEDLEQGMATHSSILAWRIPWTTEEPGGPVYGIRESDMTERLTLSLSFQKRRESFQMDKAGNGVSERGINMCKKLKELLRCLAVEGC